MVDITFDLNKEDFKRFTNKWNKRPGSNFQVSVMFPNVRHPIYSSDLGMPAFKKEYNNKKRVQKAKRRVKSITFDKIFSYLNAKKRYDKKIYRYFLQNTSMKKILESAIRHYLKTGSISRKINDDLTKKMFKFFTDGRRFSYRDSKGRIDNTPSNWRISMIKKGVKPVTDKNIFGYFTGHTFNSMKCKLIVNKDLFGA